jgi:hypothetical protein
VPIPQGVLERLGKLVKKLREIPEAQIDIEIEDFIRANKDVATVLIGVGATIILATLIEDVLTGGVGVLDDAATLTLGYRIIKLASKFKV